MKLRERLSIRVTCTRSNPTRFELVPPMPTPPCRPLRTGLKLGSHIRVPQLFLWVGHSSLLTFISFWLASLTHQTPRRKLGSVLSQVGERARLTFSEPSTLLSTLPCPILLESNTLHCLNAVLAPPKENTWIKTL